MEELAECLILSPAVCQNLHYARNQTNWILRVSWASVIHGSWVKACWREWYFQTHSLMPESAEPTVTLSMCNPGSAASPVASAAAGMNCSAGPGTPAGISAAPNTPWLNYVPRKMPDVRSRYALYTNMRRFIYCMLYLMYECSAAFTIRSVSLPLITPFSHDSLTKTCPLPLISVRLLFILYCYNLQTRCISLVLKFRTTL